MASNSISDHVPAIDQHTIKVQPAQAQLQPSPRPAGFMDFTNLEAAFKACDLIANSNFCPQAFKGKPGDVLCAIQYGMEIGLSPMQALQTICVIQGKPSIYGDGLMALCRSFSECEDIQESFDETTMMATCRVKRKGMSEVVSTYSKKNAEEAKLWGKKGYNGQDTPWVTYPKRMLQMRARGFALRDAFADRLKGIITAEEARDYPVQEERHLNVVRPISTKVIPQATPLKIKDETKNHLKFLIAQCEVPQVTVNKWFKKANVTKFEDFTEEQAVKAIEYLEANNFEAKQAWIDFLKVRESYEHEQQLQDMTNDEEQQGVAINA